MLEPIDMRNVQVILTVAVEDRSHEPSLNEEKCDIAIAEAMGEG